MFVPSFIQMSPVAGGVLAGVLHTILGPDHLCTIVTLSACQGAEAFWFGVRWAGGHLSGMAVIGLCFTAFNYHTSHLNLETYEHYAYYGVGFMLMFMGVYFILFADKYFDQEWSPKQASCACHGKAHSPAESLTNPHSGTDYGSALEKKHGVKPIPGFRETGSILIGFIQGIACPAGAVGMVFLKQYSPIQMCVFITMFLIVATLAMGLLAMAYGMLTRHCVSSMVLGRTIYYASCGLSLTFGAAWVVLNANYRLEAWLGHDHEHAHAMGHHHDHAHMMFQETTPGRLPDLFLLAR